MSYGSMGGYGGDYGRYYGDPFLGGLLKGAGKLIGGAAKVVGGVVGGPVGGILSGVGGLLAPTKKAAAIQQQVGAVPYGGPMMNVMQMPPAPIVGIPGMIPTATGMPPGTRITKQGTVTARKRPRMNPHNPRALRRSARRLEAHIREHKKIERSLRKLAPARRSRRDLPSGHTHVR